MIRPTLLAAGFALLAAPAFAVGSGHSNDRPTRTQTTIVCPDGTVYNEQLGGCVVIQDSNLQLNQDRLLETARELAYVGRHDDAIELLELSAHPEDSLVLTYLGFSHRSAGRIDTGLNYYDHALAADPNNLLARAYMGMAYVNLGAPEHARAQLLEIRARGGAGGWPEEALARAIAQGSSDGVDF